MVRFAISRLHFPFRKSLIGFAFGALFIPSQLIAQDKTGDNKPKQMMTWTDSTGKNKIEAEFVKLEGVKLFLKKADGKEVTVTLNRLDDKSRLRARSIAKRGLPSASAGPIPVAGPPVEFPASSTAEEFKNIVVGELKKNNLIVFWDALPEKRQLQVEDLVKLASTKVEQRTLDQIKKFRNDVLTMLRSKKEFVLNSKALKLPPEIKSTLEQAYDPIVEMIESALPEELLDGEHIQQTKFRDLLNNFLIGYVSKASAVEQFMPNNREQSMKALDDLKVESKSSREAIVHFPAPTATAGLGPMVSITNDMKFVVEDGRWLPEDMLKNWDNAMGQAVKSVQAADPKALHRSIGQGLFAVTAFMGAFSQAETQEDFDSAVEQVMGTLSSVPGMLAGGPRPGAAPANTPTPPTDSRPRKQLPIAP